MDKIAILTEFTNGVKRNEAKGSSVHLGKWMEGRAGLLVGVREGFIKKISFFILGLLCVGFAFENPPKFRTNLSDIN